MYHWMKWFRKPSKTGGVTAAFFIRDLHGRGFGQRALSQTRGRERMSALVGESPRGREVWKTNSRGDYPHLLRPPENKTSAANYADAREFFKPIRENS